MIRYEVWASVGFADRAQNRGTKVKQKVKRNFKQKINKESKEAPSRLKLSNAKHQHNNNTSLPITTKK